MKFVTYRNGSELRLGLLDREFGILDLNRSSQRLLGRSTPESLRKLIDGGADALDVARETLRVAREEKTGEWLPSLSTRLATPLPEARKNIFCVGRNYKAHISEMWRAAGREGEWPKVPEFFSKPPTTVIGHEDGVERHAAHTDQLDYEVEIAVVIGKKGRNIAAKDAFTHVFGYTVVNDITARDAQRNHHQFFKGKSYDTFCPIGPCVVTADEYGDPSGRRLTMKVNGHTRQDSNTSDLLFNIPKIIEALSWGLTLEPEDIIATGTPHGVAAGMTPPGWLQVGDVMEAEVEGIGVLRNTVVAG